ncbi:MAG: GtrA family protein, partial [Actinobacteria bacterium]|nr:GtrA family protein [Actinomycetota bacterium]
MTTRERIVKMARYSAVSVIATATSLTVLGLLVSTHAVSPVTANVIATAVGTVPSFELNRRWVWRKTGRRSVWREVAPFWVLSFTGLAVSTAAVAGAAAWCSTAGIA